MAPPTPWIVRATIRTGSVVARAASSVPPASPASTTRSVRFFPNMSPSRPAIGVATEAARRYVVKIHATPVGRRVEILLQRRQGRHDEGLQHRVAAAGRARGSRAQGRGGTPMRDPAPRLHLAHPIISGWHAPLTGPGERPLRRDARENRDRILAAAREAFAELGHRRERGGDRGPRRRRRRHALPALPDEGRAGRGGLRGASRPRSPRPPSEALEADRSRGRGCSATSTHVVGLQAADRGLSEILGAQLRTEQLARPGADAAAPARRGAGRAGPGRPAACAATSPTRTSPSSSGRPGGSSTRRATSRRSSGGATSRCSWTASGRAARRRCRGRR